MGNNFLLAEAPYPLHSLSLRQEEKRPLPWVEMGFIEHAPRLLSDRTVK